MLRIHENYRLKRKNAKVQKINLLLFIIICEIKAFKNA